MDNSNINNTNTTNPAVPAAPTPIPDTVNQTPAPAPKPSVELSNASVPSGKSHMGLYVVLGIIIVLVALIGTAFWYLNNNSQNLSQSQNNAQVAKVAPTPEDYSQEINALQVSNVDTSPIDQDLQQLK